MTIAGRYLLAGRALAPDGVTVPVVGGHAAAVDAVREQVGTIKQGDQLEGKGKNATGGGRDVFVGAPVGIRFTEPSERFLSPDYEYFDASVAEDVDTGWYQAYERFDAFGTFDNKFTDSSSGSMRSLREGRR